ncbi:hypothetical protein [Pelagicoccus albus]|uniref:Uncharacterized protein n=1 Tax=Pelagicoccus albus TaxID=415222 RepID=A0A7X1B3H0_9BACT|nr:hypothetical protein [Pelagicoccus albus]MBC2604719.1 hypothetical protein [Pelagicoccus albus]
MDDERLRQLKRQKSLILEHLNWIDQEIARVELSSTPSVPSKRENRLAEAFPEDRPVEKSLDPESSPQNQVAADLYSELGPDTKNAVADTKKGCLLIGAAAFASLAALVCYVIFFY